MPRSSPSRKAKSAPRRAAPSSAVSPVLYAVGDVHGYLALLRELWARIEADAAQRLVRGRRAKVIFLGDFIDRGPESRGVLEWLNQLRLQPPAWCEPVFLFGNHEMLMFASLSEESPSAFGDWILNGGDTTLRSFGITDFSPRTVPVALRAALRPALAEFFLHVKLYHEEPGFLFVHAGLKPGVPLAEQSAEELLWIRGPFLESRADHGWRVVHGHTPTSDGRLEIRANRINVDTGAYRGGPLSAAVLDGDEVEVLQVRAPLD